jgi:hypothetical protein
VAARLLVGAAAPQAHEAAQVARGAVEPAVGRQGLHQAVKFMVGAVVAVHILPGGMALQAFMQAAQLGQVVFAGALGGFQGAAAFEHGHHREQLLGVGIGQLHHLGAAARHQGHQPFSGQHLQCLAQRRAADLPLRRQGQLVDPAAGRQLALEHHVAQPGGHAVVHRGAVQGDGIGHGDTVIL